MSLRHGVAAAPCAEHFSLTPYNGSFEGAQRPEGLMRAANILIDSILTFSRELAIPVVAEGIETPGEREALTGLGCDLLQGYLFGRPAGGFTLPQWSGRTGLAGQSRRPAG